MIAYIMTKDALSIVLNGVTYTVDKTNTHFKTVVNALNKKDEKALAIALDKVKALTSSGIGVTIVDNKVFYNNLELHGTMVNRLLEEVSLGLDGKRIINFINNLMLNPDQMMINDLYEFLEHGQLPITEDGEFLAYKVVKPDFFDKHTGKFSNKVGKLVTMKRDTCDTNRNNHCSTGLHFCSWDYMRQFYSDGDKIVSVKINPKNVVSFPNDLTTKGRCCEYLVMEDLTSLVDVNADKSTAPEVMNNKNSNYYTDNAVFEDVFDTIFGISANTATATKTKSKVVDKVECDHCESENLHRKGQVKRQGGMFWRYQCQDCGSSTFVAV